MANYTNHPSRSRPKGINYTETAELRLQHPDWSLERIGKEVGVSRERVRQLLKESKLPTSRTKPQYQTSCKHCGKTRITTRTTAINLYCSEECRHQACRVTLTCSNCGSNFQTRQKQLGERIRHGTKRYYCSVKCRNEGNSKYHVTVEGRAQHGQAEWVVVGCAQCGKEIKIREKMYNHRVGKRTRGEGEGGGRVFCSREHLHLFWRLRGGTRGKRGEVAL